MYEPHTCHLPNSTTLFCIGVGRLGLAEALPYHHPDIVVSDITELGDRR